jgi:hypothetical protein
MLHHFEEGIPNFILDDTLHLYDMPDYEAPKT